MMLVEPLRRNPQYGLSIMVRASPVKIILVPCANAAVMMVIRFERPSSPPWSCPASGDDHELFADARPPDA